MTPAAIPNLISLFRMALIAPVVYLLVAERYTATLVVFAIAGLSDLVDGFLAKRYGWHSRLGGIIDPLADKVLLIGAFVTLGYLGLVPWWLVVLAVGRDLVIMSGATAYRALIGPVTAEPTRLSKLNTLVEILYVFLVIIHAGYDVPGASVMVVATATLVFTVAASGIHYVVDWSRRAWVNARREGSR